MRSTHSKAVAASLIIALAILLGTSVSARICDHCGALADETHWYTPFTWLDVYHSGPRIAATPVSVTLTSLGLADAAAPHHWVLVHRLSIGGEGLGVGHHLFVTVQSDRVAQLIRAAHVAGDAAFRDHLVRCVFQRETSTMLSHLAATAPVGAFSDAAAFKQWKRDKAAEIQRFLHINPPNQAMQLTTCKADVYASGVCRRKRMLRSMHRGLAAAVDVFAFPAPSPLPCAAVPSTRRLPSRRVLVAR